MKRTMVLSVLFVLMGIQTALGQASYTLELVAEWGGFGTGDGHDGQFNQPTGIAVGSDGFVYVIDMLNQRVNSFTKEGDFICCFGHGTLSNWMWGIVVDDVPQVYIADAGNGLTRVYHPNGTILGGMGVFGSGPGQFLGHEGIDFSPDGQHIYTADVSNHRVQKTLKSNGAFVLQWGSFGSGNGQFMYPRSVATDSYGNIYVVDQHNHRVQKFSSSGTFIRKWGTFGYGNGQFVYPARIAISPDDLVMIGDGNSLQLFDTEGNFLARFGGFWPFGLAFDEMGDVYLTKGTTHMVQRYRLISSQDHVITANSATGGSLNPSGSVDVSPGSNQTFTFHPQPGYGVIDVLVDGLSVGPMTSYTFSNVSSNHSIQPIFDPVVYSLSLETEWGGLGTGNGQFNEPTGITVTFEQDASPQAEYVLVVDQLNQRVQKFRTDGTYVHQFGGGGGAAGGFPFSNFVWGIASNLKPHIDFSGVAKLFISDGGNGIVQMASPYGLTTYFQFGSFGSGPGQFYAHSGIAVGHDGNVFVADGGNNRIQKLSADGTFILQWGSYGNGNGQFNTPVGIAVDTLGDVYVADASNHRIQKFSCTGTFLGSWGGYGSGDGQFSNPQGIAVRNDGLVVVGEAFTNRLQFFDSDGNFLQKFDNLNLNGPVGIAFSEEGEMCVTNRFAHTVRCYGVGIVPKYSITASGGTGGSILPSGTTVVSEGGNQTFTITPDPGYDIFDVLVDGVSVGTPSSYTFANVSANHTINVTFVPSSHTITATAGLNGTISPAGDVEVTNGATQLFIILPDPGYEVTNVVVDGSSVGAVETFVFTNVTSNHTIHATFSPAIITITATADSNGSINPSGAVLVTGGSNQSFSITPDPGYGISDVLVDGSSIGSVSAYEFSNIIASHSIHASYTPLPGVISGAVSVGGSGLANVTVKLLTASGDPDTNFLPLLTNVQGQYSFASVASNLDYQVMIVEPLGYSADANPKVTFLPPGGTVIVDFSLTQEVVANNARSWGYWRHQFDVYVLDRGDAQETVEALTSYITGVHDHYTPHFAIFAGLMTFEDWQNQLKTSRQATMLQKATGQIAGLVLNLVALKIGQYTVVTDDSRTTGDVLTYVSILVTDGDASNDELAKDLAENVINHEMIAAGVVPPGDILYKGRPGVHWSFDMPREFVLTQNYPNPFNPTTTIEYDLPVDGYVSLRVYTILGEEVATLVDQNQYAGRYYVRLDGSNFSSGMYFYRLRAGSFIDTKRLLLLK